MQPWHRGVVVILWPALAWAQPASDAELYASACAACHGDDGQGRAPADVGFSTPLPDFSDCAFASREPDPDWYAVIHQGGPVRAFDRMMPAFGAALTTLEIDAILRHVRTFCTDDRWPRGEFNVPRPLFTEKAYPEDEIVVTTTVDPRGPGAVEGEYLYERRVGPTGMWELALPLGVRGVQDATGAARGPAPDVTRDLGLGDVSLGYKQTVHHDLNRGSIFSVGAEAVLARVRDSGFLGGRATIFEPFAAYAQLLPGDAFVQAQVLAEVAASDDAHHAAELRVTLGRTWTRGEFGRAWTPMVEVLVERELTAGSSPRVDLVPQVQVSLNPRQHVLLNAGVRFPAGRADGRGARLVVYLLWDWFDGGFLDGW